jgi:hypothetical protein
MVPLGYITLHELVNFVATDAAKANKPDDDRPWWRLVDDAADALLGAITSGALPLYVEKDGAVYRIPYEDIGALSDYAKLNEIMHPLLSEGFFPFEPTEEDLEPPARTSCAPLAARA